MKINTTRWGAPESWIDYNASAEIKRPSNAKASYDLAYGINTSTPDESMHTNIDLSIAPWGINKNSLLNKRYYVAPWIDSTTQYPCELIPINEDELEKSKPLIINGRERIYNASGGAFSANSILDGNARLVNDYNPNFPAYSSVSSITNWAFNNVIVNFNYHKIVLCPFIVCSSGTSVNDTNIFNYSSWERYTFDDFIANYDTQIKGKKVVRGFLWFEYLGNNGSRSSNNSEYSMQFTIPYKVPKRPDITGMSYNDRRYPKIDIETMLSTGAQTINQNARACIGSFVNTRVDWLRWWDAASSAERSVNWWSGANSSNTNHDRRTIVYDDSIFEWYYQPYVSGQNRNGAAIIRTENRTAQEIVDYFAKQMAYLGFMFAWNETDAQSGIIGENNSICIPTFDGGITTGNYTRGTENVNNPAFLWRDDVWDKNNYDPYNKGEEDFGELTNRTVNRLHTQGTRKYVGGISMINTLQSFLNGTYLPDNPALIADFKGSNPQDYIVSVQKYPFPLPHNGSPEIAIGSVPTGITAAYLYSGALFINSDCTFDFGEIAISRYYRDFRDFLSKITLLMPFVGSVDLDPKLYIGHNLGLKYIIDFDTGSVAAEIKRDGLTMETKTSSISITIPFFAANMGAYQNALAQTGFAIEQSKIKQIAGIMSSALSVGGTLATGGAASDTARLGMAGGLVGGVTSMISGQVQQQALQYELEHTAPQIGTISVSAPANAFFMDNRARVLIVRPKMLPDYDPELYSHTVGNACAVPGTLSSFSGYTVAGAAELSSITARDGSGVSPTAEELRMIKQALQSGIYV